jgi:hypothetical protein
MSTRKQSICLFCEERPSELPNGSCKQCDELNDLILAAARHAKALGLSYEKFTDLADAAADVVWNWANKPIPDFKTWLAERGITVRVVPDKPAPKPRRKK